MASTATTTEALKLYGADEISFEGHTLLIPAICIGSVGQLTSDLLIHHQPLALKYVGIFDSTEFCLPYACPPDQIPDSTQKPTAVKQGPLGLSLQLYSNTTARLTVLQQRSPTLKSAKHAFVSALTQWAKSVKIAEILILGSLDSACRVDAEMETPLVHLASPAAIPSQANVLQHLAHFSPPFQSEPALRLAAAPSTQNAIPHLPGSGLTRLFLQAGTQQLPVGTLLLFVHEGDNRGDAHALGTIFINLLYRAGLMIEKVRSDEQTIAQFKEPRSWLSLFGWQADLSMYG